MLLLLLILDLLLLVLVVIGLTLLASVLLCSLPASLNSIGILPAFFFVWLFLDSRLRRLFTLFLQSLGSDLFLDGLILVLLSQFPHFSLILILLRQLISDDVTNFANLS